MKNSRASSLIRALRRRSPSRYHYLDALTGEQPETVAELTRAFAALEGDPFHFAVPRRSTIADLGAGSIAAEASLAGELEWAARSVRAFAADIVAARRELTTIAALVDAGSTTAAKDALTQHHSARGWSLRSTMLLIRLQLAEDPTRSTAQAHQLAEQARDGIVTLVVLMAAAKAQPNARARDISSQIDEFISPAVVEGESMRMLLRAHLRALLMPSPFLELSARECAFHLSMSGRYGVVDRYDTLLTCIRSAHEGGFEPKAVRRALSQLRRDFASDWQVTRLLESTAQQPVAPPDPVLLSALDEYTTGRYAAAADAATRALNSGSASLEWHALLAESRLRLADASGYAPAGRTARRIADVLAGRLRLESSPGSPDAATEAIALQLHPEAMALQLASLSQSAHETQVRAWTAVDAVTPRALRLLQPASLFQQSLQEWLRLYPGAPTVAIHAYSEMVSETIPSHIPTDRAEKFIADRQADLGALADAAAAYERLIARDPLPHQSRRLILKLIPIQLELGQPLRAARILVDVSRRNVRAVPREIARQVHEAANTDAPREYMRSLVRPLLARIVFGSRVADGEDDIVREALADFLALQGCSGPADLMHCSYDNPHDLIDVVLDLASVERLEWFMDSAEDTLEARVALLHHLRDASLSKRQRERVLEELAEHQSRLAMQQVIEVADRAKVFVDEAGVRRLARTRTSTELANLAVLSVLSDVHVVLVLDGRTGESSVRLNESAVDWRRKAFRRVFRQVRDVFVNSPEFGLDSFLSVQVRHATLAGHLRSPFEKSGLICTLSQKQQEYLPNTAWHAVDPDTLQRGESLQRALADFSRAIDSTIGRFKREEVQLRTEDSEDSRARLDFAFSDDYIDRLLDTVDLAHEDRVLDAVINALWQRTHSTLADLRRVIMNELHLELDGHLDSLVTFLRANRSWIIGDPLAAVERTRTELQQEVETIAQWFVVQTDLTYPDCSIATLLAVAKAWVREEHGQRIDEFIVSSELECPLYVASRNVRPLLSVLFILLENVARHSGARSPHARISIIGSADTFAIAVCSPVVSDDLPDVSLQARRLLSALRSGRAGEEVRREGGSGYAKLAKLVTVDLQRERATARVSLNSRREYTVEVTFESDDIFVGLNS